MLQNPVERGAAQRNGDISAVAAAARSEAMVATITVQQKVAKRKLEVARTYTDTARQSTHSKATMKVARAFVPAMASSNIVAARAGVALVQRRFVGAVAKAHALGYRQVVHDAVDFIKMSLRMRARTPLCEHLVLVSTIGEDDFSDAARLVATPFGTHRSDPQQFETQGSLSKDAVKYDARCLKTVALRFF